MTTGHIAGVICSLLSMAAFVLLSVPLFYSIIKDRSVISHRYNSISGYCSHPTSTRYALFCVIVGLTSASVTMAHVTVYLERLAETSADADAGADADDATSEMDTGFFSAFVIVALGGLTLMFPADYDACCNVVSAALSKIIHAIGGVCFLFGGPFLHVVSYAHLIVYYHKTKWTNVVALALSVVSMLLSIIFFVLQACILIPMRNNPRVWYASGTVRPVASGQHCLAVREDEMPKVDPDEQLSVRGQCLFYSSIIVQWLAIMLIVMVNGLLMIKKLALYDD